MTTSEIFKKFNDSIIQSLIPSGDETIVAHGLSGLINTNDEVFNLKIKP